MKRKRIGIVCCSNGMKTFYAKKLHALETILEEIGLEPVFSDCIYEENDIFSAPAKRRAKSLMKFYEDDEITDIFDISGGDLANGILPYLDYDVIAKSDKRFFGYSDLTTVLNAIYARTGKVSGLYQIRNVLSEYKEQHIKDIQALYEGEVHEASRFHYRFVQGQSMEGIVIGGNIRCFLKLAGTQYMPDFQDKILLLESRSGLIAQMETYLSQLQQMGAFDKAAGILLGTFSELEKEREQYPGKNINLKNPQYFDGCSKKEYLKACIYPQMADLICNYVSKDFPIAVTRDIGHGLDAGVIGIGAFYRLISLDN